MFFRRDCFNVYKYINSMNQIELEKWASWAYSTLESCIVTVYLLSFFSFWNSAMRKKIQFIISLGHWVYRTDLHFGCSSITLIDLEPYDPYVPYYSRRDCDGVKIHSVVVEVKNSTLLTSMLFPPIWRPWQNASDGISHQRCNQSAQLIVWKWKLTYWLLLIFVVCFR